MCDTCYSENNFRCEDCYKPDDTFQVIRRSHIEQYAGCPYSLYLQLVMGIVPPMGSHAQLGVIVHEIIDQIQSGDIGIQESHAILQRRIDEWNVSTDDEYSLITLEQMDSGAICLNNFWLIKGELNDQFETEYLIKYSIDDDLPMISCTLDRISHNKGEIHIHDWKTGKPMSGKKLITDLQPPLYIYGVYKEFGKWPKTFTLHYLRHNKHITYRLNEEGKYEVKTSRNTYILDIDAALKKTRKILNGIRHNRFNMPSDTHQWRCDNMCWFGLSGKCKGSQRETWKKLNEQYASA